MTQEQNCTDASGGVAAGGSPVSGAPAQPAAPIVSGAGVGAAQADSPAASADTAVPSAAAASRKAAIPDGLPVPRRHWATVVMTLGITVTVLDASMSNVALPAISASLGIPASQAVWVVLAYSLTVVGCMLPLAALAERVGFQLMFGVGMSIFLLTSLSSALSSTMTQLVVSRVGQGLGAAMLMCLFGGIVRNIYPLSRLSAGIGLNAFVVGIMAVLGPTLGALMLQWFTWPAIFLVNIPLGLVTFLGLRTLPDIPRRSGPFDWTACALSAALFALALFGLETVGRDLALAGLCLGVAAVIAWILLRRSWGQPAPVVPVDLLRIRSIGYAVAASAFFFAAQMAAFVALPFYFKTVYGASYALVGLYLGTWAIGGALMAPLSAYVAGRFPVAVLCALGAIVMMLGLSGVLLAPQGNVLAWLLVSMFLGGIGFGFFQTPNNRAMLGGTPRHRSGAAGGMQATTRVFGQGVGTACVGVAFQLSTAHGAAFGVGVAALFALAALTVNVVRHFDPTPDARF